MAKTTYEIWRAISSDGVAQVVLLQAGQIETERPLLDGVPILLTTFEANSYIEAAQMRNDFFGWGKYHPMKEDLDDGDAIDEGE
ncbi:MULTISPECIES: hypothetical protein [unclassified Cupriavidus]|uniref:hypothetical protein n=1 Tax=unclassified Cupriavidus TaxID=2640874 RepID=UPI001C008C35|nr:MULTISPECIES: hypothetical protein [unclassified Cupriavidus]MCA3184111.1 hypothetical protein [Cupriavidus sp.]MCA3192654.1 hypothetical protein [Cupriavidus sp.]MCA3194855.1 hypothetical protein [Cupriavidus sp.]MCA3200493.1 hypothetical protein [Cupriavidus sp.]MCA3210100.1 hypothetical protein [Cupriavidus sp.]